MKYTEYLKENMVHVTVFGLMGAVILLTAIFYGGKMEPESYITQKLASSVVELDYDKLSFAGDRVILDETNISGIQKLEKELLITQFNIYQFLLYHKRAPLYFPYIEKILKQYKVPDDFKYLAVAESGLRNDAISSASAAGIWQFIPETGRRYGLYIDNYVDERYHFKKATVAAAQYLASIHQKIERRGYPGEGSWTLAAAGYNRGENGILLDLEGQPTADGYYNLILNEETGRYIYRIVAIKYLMQLREALFPAHVLRETFSYPDTKQMKLSGPILDLRVWALENNQDYYEIRELNPWILGHVLPEGEWTIELLKK